MQHELAVNLGKNAKAPVATVTCATCGHSWKVSSEALLAGTDWMDCRQCLSKCELEDEPATADIAAKLARLASEAEAERGAE